MTSVRSRCVLPVVSVICLLSNWITGAPRIKGIAPQTQTARSSNTVRLELVATRPSRVRRRVRESIFRALSPDKQKIRVAFPQDASTLGTLILAMRWAELGEVADIPFVPPNAPWQRVQPGVVFEVPRSWPDQRGDFKDWRIVTGPVPGTGLSWRYVRRSRHGPGTPPPGFLIKRRPVGIRHTAFSADGARFAAAYFRSGADRAMFRWSAWAAVWDLTTGQRTILGAAMSPVAISPDGQLLATAVIDPSLVDWQRASSWARRNRRMTRPALWRFGKEYPFRILRPGGIPRGSSDKPNPGVGVNALAFHPDGHHLISATRDGMVLAWPLSNRGEPSVTECPNTSLRRPHLVFYEKEKRFVPGSRLAFHQNGRLLSLVSVPSRHRGTSGPVERLAWRVDPECRLFERVPFPELAPVKGKYRAQADKLGIIRIVDTSTGKVRHTLRLDSQSDPEVKNSSVP